MFADAAGVGGDETGTCRRRIDPASGRVRLGAPPWITPSGTSSLDAPQPRVLLRGHLPPMYGISATRRLHTISGTDRPTGPFRADGAGYISPALARGVHALEFRTIRAAFASTPAEHTIIEVFGSHPAREVPELRGKLRDGWRHETRLDQTRPRCPLRGRLPTPRPHRLQQSQRRGFLRAPTGMVLRHVEPRPGQAPRGCSCLRRWDTTPRHRHWPLDALVRTDRAAAARAASKESPPRHPPRHLLFFHLLAPPYLSVKNSGSCALAQGNTCIPEIGPECTARTPTARAMGSTTNRPRRRGSKSVDRASSQGWFGRPPQPRLTPDHDCSVMAHARKSSW